MSTQTVRPTNGQPAAKRRTQAIAGALAGLVVVIVLFAVFFGVKAGKSDKPAAAPAAAAASADPTAEPTAEPSAAAPTEEPSTAQPAAVDTPAALSKQPDVKAGQGTVTKLTVTPLVKGTGPVVKAGQTITVNYVVVTYKDGKLVDSSWQTGQPFSTPIGTGALIKGWDQAIPGQKVGSRLQLDVPAALAYGAQQGDLRFVVDILAAK
jgi:peptidylprolyl isomerase